MGTYKRLKDQVGLRREEIYVERTRAFWVEKPWSPPKEFKEGERTRLKVRNSKLTRSLGLHIIIKQSSTPYRRKFGARIL